MKEIGNRINRVYIKK